MRRAGVGCGVAGLTGCAMAFGVLFGSSAQSFAAPVPPPICSPAGSIEMRAADGRSVTGSLRGSGAFGVVLVHGLAANRCEWNAVTAFDDLGAVLAIDVRADPTIAPPPTANPPPTRRGSTTTVSLAAELTTGLQLDIDAAVRELHRRGVRSVVLVGSSLGGAAVLVAAASTSTDVQAVVALSPTLALGGQNSLEATPEVRVPVLIAGSEDDGADGITAAENARTLVEIAVSAPSRTLRTYPGTSHGSELLRPGRPAVADVRVFLAPFVNEALSRPAPTTSSTRPPTSPRPTTTTTTARRRPTTTVKHLTRKKR